MTFALDFVAYWPALVGLAMGASGLALAFIVLRNRRRRDVATHGPAFRRLCEGLSVSRLDRWRLSRLSSKAGLITPAVLLVSRGAFENALVRAAVHPNAKWVEAFRARIFASE